MGSLVLPTSKLFPFFFTSEICFATDRSIGLRRFNRCHLHCNYPFNFFPARGEMPAIHVYILFYQLQHLGLVLYTDTILLYGLLKEGTSSHFCQRAEQKDRLKLNGINLTFRLIKAQQSKYGGCYISQRAFFLFPTFVYGEFVLLRISSHDERHRVRGMGRMRGSGIGVKHLLGVPVVRGDEQNVTRFLAGFVNCADRCVCFANSFNCGIINSSVTNLTNRLAAGLAAVSQSFKRLPCLAEQNCTSRTRVRPSSRARQLYLLHLGHSSWDLCHMSQL